MNHFYRLLLNFCNKQDNTYLLKPFPKEKIYVYKNNSFLPLGIIIGSFINIPEHDIIFFNLEYIRVRKKRQGIATDFLIRMIEKYEIKAINYLPGSNEGKLFFVKMQGYFAKNGIEDIHTKKQTETTS